MSYFFCEVLQEAAPQKRIYKVAYCSKFNRLKWSRASFLCCYAAVEKTIRPLPCLKFPLNSIKTVCVPVKPRRIISAKLATRR